MIPGAALRLTQAVLFGGLALAGPWLQRGPLAPEPLWITVSVVGAVEREDGLWEGRDPLAHPGAAVDRFQVTLGSSVDATAQVWTVDAAKAGQGQLRTRQVSLEAGRAYAFPSPSAFYALAGEASPLRLRVCAGGEDRPGTATFHSVVGQAVYPLSDGSPFPVEQRLYRVEGCGELALSLRAR